MDGSDPRQGLDGEGHPQKEKGLRHQARSPAMGTGFHQPGQQQPGDEFQGLHRPLHEVRDVSGGDREAPLPESEDEGAVP